MTIFGLRVFDQVLALTGGGPVDASETLATQVWKQTFVLGKYGYGASLALVLSALVMAITLVQLVVLRRRERIA
jgi:raffinose/stachyose/melibiose transport system permease protein